MLTNKKNKKLVYCFVKKNANSSAKLFFAKHLGIEHKNFFIPRINQTNKIKKTYSNDYDSIGDRIK